MSTTTETHDEHDELDHEGKFNIKTFKIIMLFVIFLCSLSGVLPKLIPAIARNNTVLSFLNCFSAGIFLGMALFHIIPEGAEQYESWATEKGIERPFPLAFVLIFVGYLIVLAVDRVIAGFLLKPTGKENEAHIGHSHGGGNSHDHDHNHDHAHHERKNTQDGRREHSSDSNLKIVPIKAEDEDGHHHHMHDHGHIHHEKEN